MAGFRITVTPRFHVDTDLLRFSFQIADVAHATVNRERGCSVVTLPEAEWSGSLTQRQKAWLYSVVVEELRLQARWYLPKRLENLAASVGEQVNGVTIKNIASRWGSCSVRKHVNLNLWLMLAPSYLIDYVILHELCHLQEMNHGARFWALLDKCTNGRARLLDKEMRQFERTLTHDNLNEK